jgi:uncharacterized OB-fold protein
MPYTLTTGRAAGTFLAELASRRIVGSRSRSTGRVAVPPRDFLDGDDMPEFVQVPETGTVMAWTRTASGTLALIRLDGADTDLVHRILGDIKGLANGARVTAVWGSAADGFLALSGFELHEVPASEGATPLDSTADPVAELPYRLDLPYRHSYGPYYGRMFDELGSQRRIVGTKCPSCHNVLIPARGNCDACFVPTGQVVDVADTGRLQAFSVIHLEFVGQTHTPPYVYAEINLDGSATRLIHHVGGFDISRAEEMLSIGTRVRAVWKEGAPARGTLADIDYFEPIADE